METCKALVFVSDFEPGVPRLYDVIQHEGAWWIVGTWLESLDRRTAIPETLVRLSGLAYQEVNQPNFRFALTNSIPISVLRGTATDGYVVAIHPGAVAQSRGPKSIH